MTTPAEQIREARGRLSRAEAARQTGLSLRSLEEWEAGRHEPNPLALPEILRRLREAEARVLGTTA